MSSLPVGFHDHALLPPHEVAEVSLDADVHLGPREPMFLAEREEALLELGQRAGGAGLVKGKRAGPNPWGSSAPEWQVPSPPPHHNFLEPPDTRHGPYDYDGKETE